LPPLRSSPCLVFFTRITAFCTHIWWPRLMLYYTTTDF
jgi:hypothetical protein